MALRNIFVSLLYVRLCKPELCVKSNPESNTMPDGKRFDFLTGILLDLIDKAQPYMYKCAFSDSVFGIPFLDDFCKVLACSYVFMNATHEYHSLPSYPLLFRLLDPLRVTAMF